MFLLESVRSLVSTVLYSSENNKFIIKDIVKVYIFFGLDDTTEYEEKSPK